MIGFELAINNKQIAAKLEQGVVSIILTRVLTEVIDSIEIDLLD